jgi:hypothetical protein
MCKNRKCVSTALVWCCDVFQTLNLAMCLLTWNDHTPKPESPVCQARTALDSNQGVPVNLTCKLTRKQQIIKYKSIGWISESLLHSVSARFCRYRKQQQFGHKERVLIVIYRESARSFRYRYATRWLDLKPTRARKQCTNPRMYGSEQSLAYNQSNQLFKI